MHRQIAEEQGLTVAEVQRALAFWINGVRYLTAIARGGARYGLDGKTDGVVLRRGAGWRSASPGIQAGSASRHSTP